MLNKTADPMQIRQYLEEQDLRTKELQELSKPRTGDMGPTTEETPAGEGPGMTNGTPASTPPTTPKPNAPTTTTSSSAKAGTPAAPAAKPKPEEIKVVDLRFSPGAAPK